MKLPILLITIFISVFFLGTMSAQSIASPTFSATGAAFSNNDHSLHFSIGEPINTFINKGTLKLSQGLIQNLIAQLPSSIHSFLLDGLSVYPNPAANFVTIENEQALRNLKFAMYSVDGKEVQPAHTLSQLKTTLSVQTLPAGIYILKITNRNQQFQNLNFIKE